MLLLSGKKQINKGRPILLDEKHLKEKCLKPEVCLAFFFFKQRT